MFLFTSYSGIFTLISAKNYVFETAELLILTLIFIIIIIITIRLPLLWKVTSYHSKMVLLQI